MVPAYTGNTHVIEVYQCQSRPRILLSVEVDVLHPQSGDGPGQIAGITVPPETGRKTPVMNAARSELRNATAFAMS